MALPKLENFNNGGVDNTLNGYNANWLTPTGSGAVNVHGDQAVVGTLVNSAASAYWNGDVFSGDHYSQFKYITGNYPCCYVRIQSGSTQGYIYVVTTGDVYKVGINNTLGSPIATGWPTGVANDVFKLTATGTSTTTLTGTKNAGAPNTVNDSSSPYTGGSAGFMLFSAGTVDDWEGGNVSTGTAYELAATAGSYAATGTNDGTAAALNVAAVAGSYGVTGDPVTPVLARGLVANAGVYAISGADATLLGNSTIIMVADAGSYAIVGDNFANQFAYNFNAAAGSLVLTGAPLGDVFGYAMGADAGAYHVVGRPAYLRGPNDPANPRGGHSLAATGAGG